MNKTITSSALLEFMNRSPATIAVETSIVLLIGLIAIGGNLLVVISIYRNPSLRTITNYFVLSLAASDVLFPAVGLPPSLIWSIKKRFTFDQKLCTMQAVFTTALAYVSIYMIVLMAINRFVRVCKPQKYRKVFNKITSLLMISFVWVISFTLVTLSITNGDSFAMAHFIPTQIRCGIVYNTQNTFSKTVGNALSAIFVLLPIGIIVYCYFKVFKKIREHKRNIAPASNPSSLGTSVQEIKVTWTMFAVLIGFCSTWIPVVIVTLISNFWLGHVLPRQANMAIPFAVLSSSAINPVIYGVMNTAFRREYTNILRCRSE
ncbi:histamine H2 receptor-like [Actinia tenebrosa]|uniref:Histamine H2 receptor-like n=1 Tax=Actinia tenebrosa TaxID=6105 RepID=A0A6P8GZE9_ACTTE|nr:histamine H2 receptor-like [Actinia tenebrosa]